MKKVLIFVVVVGLIVLGALYYAGSNLGPILKAAMEKVGPQATQTTLTVDSVELSPRAGSGSIKGLVIGNPQPYKEPFSIRLGQASLSLDPSTVLSEKVVIRSIRVTDPEVTIEGGLSDNNLQKLLANITSYTGGASAKPGAGQDSGSQKKLQVDEFVLSGVKVNIKLNLPGISGAMAPLTLPEVRLQNLGAGGSGITPAELSKAVVNEIINSLMPALTAQVSKLGQGALDSAVKKLTEGGAGGALEKAAGGLGDLLKKKK